MWYIMMSHKRAQPESGTVFYVFPYMLYNTLHLRVDTFSYFSYRFSFIVGTGSFIFSAGDERFFLIFFFPSPSPHSLQSSHITRITIPHIFRIYCINFLLGIIFAFCLATYLVNVLYVGVTGISFYT